MRLGFREEGFEVRVGLGPSLGFRGLGISGFN